MAGRDFEAVFGRLRAILEPYGRSLHVAEDRDGWYSVDLAPEGERDPTTWFAGIRRGKRYVSYYLMPVYVEPSLLDGVSPGLRRRMQGKSCFNFTRVDEALFEELAALTRAGYEQSAGDARWGTAKRVEHGMAHRRAFAKLEGVGGAGGRGGRGGRGARGGRGGRGTATYHPG
jgi:hypothetical protein